MARWQRHARIALGLVVLAVPIAVGVALHRRAAPPEGSGAAPRVEPNAVAESTAGVVTQIKGAHETFRVAYQRQLTFTDGSTRLSGVTVSVDHRGGRNFVVTADRGQVGSGNSRVALTGHVRITVSDGLHVQTHSAVYTQGDGMVRATREPVTFSRAGMTGHSVGMTYDKNNDILSLVKDAVIHIAPDPHGHNGADLTAGSAEFVRRHHLLIFQGGVHLVRGGETVEAESGTAYLTDDEKHLTMLNLRGGSRITGVASAAGGLRGLAARNIDLQYRPDGGAIEQATLAGGAQMAVAGETTRLDRHVAADQLDVAIGPDGSTVTRLAGRGHVALTFPPQGDVPARTIHADSLAATGDTPGAGLNAAQLDGHVDYRERLKGGDRVARSAQLNLELAPGLGDVRTARFSNGVRIEENGMQAVAAAARYDVARGVMDLSGRGPDGGPHVVDARIIVDATAIALTPDGPALHATGNVRSVLKPAAGAGAGGAGADGTPTRMPAILKADQPVNVTGDTLVYDGPAAHAVYTGHARLWQADTAIQGDELVIDDRTGNLTATGSVRSSMLITEQDDKTQKPKRSPMVAQAQNLQYDDDTRRATYTTGAHLDGPAGDLTADRIELYLSAGGDEIERLEGYQQVTLKDTGRIVTGDRLSYFQSDARYLVTGAPVKITEECRETLGKSLTFFRSTDRMIVDGGGTYRTQTLSGTNCSGPHGG